MGFSILKQKLKPEMSIYFNVKSWEKLYRNFSCLLLFFYEVVLLKLSVVPSKVNIYIEI